MNNKKRNGLIALVLLALALMSFGKKPEGEVEVGEGEFGDFGTDGELDRSNSGSSNSGGQTRVEPDPEDLENEPNGGWFQDYEDDYEGTRYGTGGSRGRTPSEAVRDAELISGAIPDQGQDYGGAIYKPLPIGDKIRSDYGSTGCRTCR